MLAAGQAVQPPGALAAGTVQAAPAALARSALAATPGAGHAAALGEAWRLRGGRGWVRGVALRRRAPG